jgi:predicted small secreted protein
MIELHPEVFMTHSLRITTAIPAAFILASCAATTAGVKPDIAAAGPTARSPACLSDTGTRIPGNGTNCSAVGRSYTSDDINSTGATTADGALRLLDPSITVHR